MRTMFSVKDRRRRIILLLAFFLVRSTVSWMMLSPHVTEFRPAILVHRKQQHRVQASSFQETRLEEDQTVILTPQMMQQHDTNSQTGDNSIDYEQWDLRFGSVGRLYGDSGSSMDNDESSTDDANSIIKRLREFTVVVIGLGGVGSWAAEALCRSGVGNLILIDLDDICISNTNRQLHAMSSTVGQMKIDQMQRRLLDINPNINVSLIHDFVSVENVKEILNDCCQVVTTRTGMPSTTTNFNMTTKLLVLDCMDGGAEKSALIAACTDRAIPIVTCGGAAGKRDPTRIVCEDLARLSGDKLLASCRLILRKEYNFPSGLEFHDRQKRKRPIKKWYIPAIYSPEIPPNLMSKNEKAEAAISRTSNLRRCDGGELGTACFVTGSFGFLAAARCVDMITGTLPLLAPKRR